MSTHTSLGLYDICAEHTKTLSSLTSALLAGADAHRKEEDTLLQSMSDLSGHLDICIQTQGEDAKDLLEEQEECTAVLGVLMSSADSFTEMLLNNTQKLNEAKIVIDCCVKSESILDDVNKSFTELYTAGADAAYIQIQNIVNKLNLLAGAIRGIQTAPKPYTGMITLYTQKLEQTMEAMTSISITLKKNEKAAPAPQSLPADVEKLRLLETELQKARAELEKVRNLFNVEAKEQSSLKSKYDEMQKKLQEVMDLCKKYKVAINEACKVANELKNKYESERQRNSGMQTENANLRIQIQGLRARLQTIHDLELDAARAKHEQRAIQAASQDPVAEFNAWAQNPSGSLPSGFQYLQNDIKIRTVQALTPSAAPTRWISNIAGSRRYLFPNPNTLDHMSNISDLYYTVSGVFKAKGQNRITIVKPCEMTDKGFIEYPGEMRLL